MASSIPAQNISKVSPMSNAAHKDWTDSIWTEHLDHISKLRTDLGYKTHWSCNIFNPLTGRSVIKPTLDLDILKNPIKKPPYTLIYSVHHWDNDIDQNSIYSEIKTTIKDGTMGSVWEAAEELYLKAEEKYEDWHYFFEIIEQTGRKGEFYLYYGS